MTITRTLLLVALLPMAACQPADTARSAAQQATAAAADAMGKTSRDAIERARRELADADIDVGEGETKAKISPRGDLLIDGKPVPVDETQRALLLAHRGNIVKVAEAGIAIGMQGANLGTRAAGGALKSLLGGNSEEFSKQMEAEGARMEAEAQKICDLLPDLLASQQAVAAALPAFAPYATMDASDVSGCRTRHAGNDEAGGQTGEALTQAPDRSTAGNADAAARVEADAPAMDAAAEADAAAARR
ncbi:hypothetical protein [Xanthomonas sp. XNM01]|uniref:hypothetical protein n=1 Tax=Xanthomonas sp. XNM01 TaxID=2769289 RepID=UPI0017846283|nr:hypothetical protein [Xanthomonas sp. XNM01]MBD9369123.1 hypothetical protein [Xanthomonas sp. XNM01]